MKQTLSFVERSALAASLGMAVTIANTASASAAGLPNVETPPGFEATEGAGGGRILSGRIPAAASGYAAFREATHAVRGRPALGERRTRPGSVRGSERVRRRRGRIHAASDERR